ncbi:ATP-binding cassette domain-containing protein [Streptococcus uberis]|uniref:ATP-binding cassette domain-containing protein n=1 Tax=Streptococcus uberis TaxID=1349 RepID=UPI003791FE66
MLEIQNGSIIKRNRVLLDEISLKFENQRVYGLVGINGSGKTMILKAITGFHRLTKGLVYQNGTIIGPGNRTISKTGLVLGDQEFISYFTLKENLTLIKKICPNAKTIDLEYWIKLFQIEKYQDIPYKDLSLGTKKKMVIIQAFMDNPDILILDEPMNALDEKSLAITKMLIKKQKEKGLVIMTSHYKNDIEDLCDTIIHVQEGKILKKD